jgi:hypothetical protein
MSLTKTVAITENGNMAAQRIFVAHTQTGKVAIEVTATTWAAAMTCTLQASIDGVRWSGLIEGNTATVFEDNNKIITLPAGLYYRIVTASYVGSVGVQFRMRSL